MLFLKSFELGQRLGF